MSIVIREIGTDEMRAVEDLQVEIWGVSEREVLPSLALIPLKEVGGVLLGAFDANVMVGFVFGFPGLEAGRPTLHSDMLAVKTEYRSLGLGYRLKLAQREQALAKGVERITWTFDPLQSRNAYLNFAKLGVLADRYCPDYYGQTTSFLHRTGTDRLWVTWLLASERVKERVGALPTSTSNVPSFDQIPALITVGPGNEPLSTEVQEERLLIEIPSDFGQIASTNLELAQRWREITRRAFMQALEHGFLVDEFYRPQDGKEKHGTYLLRRKMVPEG